MNTIPSIRPHTIVLEDIPNHSQHDEMSEHSRHALRSLHNLRQGYKLNRLPKVRRDQLINAINLLHFRDGHLWAHIRRPEGENNLLIKAYPEPCLNNEVNCHLDPDLQIDLDNYRFENLLVEDGDNAFLIPMLNGISIQSSLKACLPEEGYILDQRKKKRSLANSVSCEIVQGNSTKTGHLIDFCSSGFHISTNKEISPMDVSNPVDLFMYSSKKLVFEGTCLVQRCEKSGSQESIILSPIQIQKKKHIYQKRIRNTRLKLSPTPNVIFTHPLSGILINYEITDITNAGFSIKDKTQDSLLMPGLIISHVSLEFNNTALITCSARVVYADQKDNTTKFGFSIFDMDSSNLFNVCSILDKAYDRHINTNSFIDLNALWKLFFDSGFIYPHKYNYLNKYKDAFKDTIQKLYHGTHGLHYHQIYQHQGRISGHISCLRAYQRLWLIHHLMALPTQDNKRVGLTLLKNIYNMFDGAYRYPSFKVDYIMFYFRPSSKFNIYFQGGFFKKINNPQACTMDLFAYEILPIHNQDTTLPHDWKLAELRSSDASNFRSFCSDNSGGLLLDALGFEKDYPNEEPLSSIYNRHGLERSTKFYALRHGDNIRAVFIVDQSDLCLNISDFLNCIKVIIPEQTELPWNYFQIAINILGAVYNSTEIPVLIYPSEYPKHYSVETKRFYYLWLLDTRYAETYIAYMKRRMNISPIHTLYRVVQAKLGIIEA